MFSKLVSLLDSKQTVQLGTNGHVELGWSNNMEEKILQFSFQLVRTKDLESLAFIYRSILFEIFFSKYVPVDKRFECGLLAYKLIAQTRDIVSGKGEYSLAHMMIWEWSNVSRIVSPEYSELTLELAKHALKCLVLNKNENETSEHPLGSWKDIKYFLNYGKTIHHKISNTYSVDPVYEAEPLFRYAITLITEQLKNDTYSHLTGNLGNISLAAKWAPREHSNKFGWIAPYIATEYFASEGWDYTAKTKDQLERLKLKKSAQYRLMLSKLNKALDTVQIKQCDKQWSKIDFDKKVTSITLSKQKTAFNNLTKLGRPRFPDNKDRVECSEHYADYISRCSKGETKIKGSRVAIYDFVKDALHYDPMEDTTDKNILNTINLQWNDNSLQTGVLENMLALVDTSGSMAQNDNKPLFNAIGLGIRIAEKSTLGKRVMTFSKSPTWVNLEGCPDFVSTVKKVRDAPWGMNTNFYAAFKLILDAYVEMDVPPSKVDNMVLTILSDMQIDVADSSLVAGGMQTMYDTMATMFAEAGLNSKYNAPYKLPVIVFWNLTSTSGFPVSSHSENAIMVSGYSPALLNLFMSNGVEALKDFTPLKNFISQLDHERYKPFELNFKSEFAKVEAHIVNLSDKLPPPPPSFEAEC
jgi:hypothetical protein